MPENWEKKIYPDAFKFSSGFGEGRKGGGERKRRGSDRKRGLKCIPHKKSNTVEASENDWAITRLMRVDINNNWHLIHQSNLTHVFRILTRVYFYITSKEKKGKKFKKKNIYTKIPSFTSVVNFMCHAKSCIPNEIMNSNVKWFRDRSMKMCSNSSVSVEITIEVSEANCCLIWIEIRPAFLYNTHKTTLSMLMTIQRI